MDVLPTHSCGETKIWCFDCRKPICRECMIATKDMLRCRACAQGATKTAPLQGGGGAAVAIANQEKFKLGFAAIVYSFIVGKLLMFLAPCLG